MNKKPPPNPNPTKKKKKNRKKTKQNKPILFHQGSISSKTNKQKKQKTLVEH